MRREQGSRCFLCCPSNVPFPQGEFGVFYDWGSLHQKDHAAGARAPEVGAFKLALDKLGTW